MQRPISSRLRLGRGRRAEKSQLRPISHHPKIALPTYRRSGRRTHPLEESLNKIQKQNKNNKQIHKTTPSLNFCRVRPLCSFFIRHKPLAYELAFFAPARILGPPLDSYTFPSFDHLPTHRLDLLHWPSFRRSVNLTKFGGRWFVSGSFRERRLMPFHPIVLSFCVCNYLGHDGQHWNHQYDLMLILFKNISL